MVLKVAWELSKTEPEVLNMLPDEFARWVAFFQIQDEQTKAASSRARPRSGANPGRGKGKK